MPTLRDRAISIMELLARCPEGLQLIEIADGLDIPRGATHRVLSDLKDSGYVRQDREGGLYCLTTKVVSLAFTFLTSSGITDISQPVLQRLAETTGELARLAVIEGKELRWVGKAQGKQTGLRYDPDDGAEVYLVAAANGHAWLSCLSNDEALELAARQGLHPEKYGPGAPKSFQDLLGRVETARRLGYATVVDAYEAGTSAIAVPVRSPGNGKPLGTLSVAGPSVRMTPERMQEMAPVVLGSAQEIASAANLSPLFRSLS